MSKISELSLTQIVNGIKKKDFNSEEVTKSFIDSSRKSKKLNAYITECFDEALKFSKNFDKKKDHKGLLSGVPIAVNNKSVYNIQNFLRSDTNGTWFDRYFKLNYCWGKEVFVVVCTWSR